MAVAADGTITPNPLISFAESQGGRNLLLMLGAAIVIAVMAGVWMWSQQPDYRVLFSNYSDRDGGAIVTQLQQMNVPYKFAEGGGAILVPAGQVHDARLRIAAMGLPKGGNVGFELMENQKLGVSQFLEQVNFQRALEGELARSIQSIAAVESARIHLALPKASVFVRDQQKPTASVMLNLHPGRTLNEQQVSAIIHLVASSVPELPPGNISVVDQNGNLLSDANKPAKANGLDPSQLKYVQEVQQNIVRRIESIITPIVGPNNVRAEATADIDFSNSEQAAETYKPNSPPNQSTMRSQQSSESQGSAASNGGVPGALSNQPAAPATAPITAPAAGATPAPGTAANPTQKETTTNFEVDKTVRYVQQPMGGVKRISVAVVVNYKQVTDKAGKVTSTPLSEAERTQISDLVKEAMGFNKDRGDTLNVVNSVFAGVTKEVFPEEPIWKKPESIQLAKELGKYLVGGIALLYLFFGVLRPMLKKFNAPPAPKIKAVVDDDDSANDEMDDTGAMQMNQAQQPAQPAEASYQQNLDMAKQMAKDDPKVVANVVKNWVNGNE
ncbi:flagellar basal-body MS-ring/collar protein FliF [Actimicrobium antarcticum]|uniref:Flagellar M-ring protein n=1 Tax=Actimicrobium antarcticum TaxID=1051899 RepID=A0ABP7SRH3_9BURK